MFLATKHSIPFLKNPLLVYCKGCQEECCLRVGRTVEPPIKNTMTPVTEVTVIPTPVSIIVRPTLWVRSIWDLSTGWLFQVWTNTNISSILSPTIRQGTRECMGPNGRPTVLDIPTAAKAALCSTLFHLPNTSLLLSAIFNL